ncbi:MAG: hypothetical protein QGI05_02060, partial [Candidatus Omnitrophota bacterium]|nr:hypothetical protein [Candidatus Omnitrophota bacterium]
PVSLENPSKKSKEKSRQEKAQEPVRPRRAGAKDTAPEIVNSDDYVESNYAHIDPAAENYEHVDPSIDPIEYYEEYGEMPSHLLEGESKLD